MAARLIGFIGFTASAAALAVAGVALAQTPAAPAPSKALKLPSISFSIGTAVLDGGPATVATGRYSLDRHIVLEGDFARWTRNDHYFYPGHTVTVSGASGYTGDWRYEDNRSGWSLGANLLFQTTYKRLTWFGGGGIGYAGVTYRAVGSVEGCVAPAGTNYYCASGYNWEDENRGWALQGKTGVDFRIAGPVMAYGSVNFTGGPVGSLGASAGVRVVARSVDMRRIDRARVARLERSATARFPLRAAIGEDVRVTLEDGSQRRGTLMSMTDTDVVLRVTDGVIDRRSTDARYQIASVRVVETTHHKAVKGLLWGLVAGAGVGIAISVGCEDEFGYCALVLAPTMAGVGAGIGAGIGGLADHLAAPSHVIYAKGSRTAQLIPIAARKGGGIGLRVRW